MAEARRLVRVAEGPPRDVPHGGLLGTVALGVPPAGAVAAPLREVLQAVAGGIAGGRRAGARRPPCPEERRRAPFRLLARRRQDVGPGVGLRSRQPEP